MILRKAVAIMMVEKVGKNHIAIPNEVASISCMTISTNHGFERFEINPEMACSRLLNHNKVMLSLIRKFYLT